MPSRRSLLALALAVAAALTLATGSPALACGHDPAPHPPCSGTPIPC